MLKKLIQKRLSSDDPILYYVANKYVFSVIKRVHITTSHGKRDRILKHIFKNCANIGRECVALFESYCVNIQYMYYLICI